MTNIKRMLEKKEDESKEQFYPETHVEGIVGLSEYVTGHVPTGVMSVNGKTGAISIEANDIGAAETIHMHQLATQSIAGFMSAVDKQKVDELSAPDSGVTSINSKTGIVTLYANDIGAAEAFHTHGLANSTEDGFFSKEDKEKIDQLTIITLETVKEV
ncbi:hypothetical protein HBP72_04040 [Listeria welshimeri]|uniref:Uncharacterized protein n=1 Tax=Listeria welshimeri TaxID=1643 RepID=A0ABX4IG30_LISWE|nr:hypothetical protein [Listeria welshimeri]MBC1251335.1 hypothetical protein [Listeria welshimeri]MBC1318877.1 hypothetical protein [Listeria welshimeri]MBC1354770.1 hypothetical protein [Listeria welshimeri]MBC1395436.1 hypothetical protein [Listeria welshimeri]MBC1409647.1 hypothetical protein [Listeria welshimeri]